MSSGNDDHDSTPVSSPAPTQSGAVSSSTSDVGDSASVVVKARAGDEATPKNSPASPAAEIDEDVDEPTLLARSIDLLEPLAWPVRRLKSSSGALSSRDFRYVWAGSFISNIGGWMQTVVVGWLIVGELGGSPMWLGLTELARGLPVFFLLPIMGVVADRMDRRRILMLANSALAVVTLVLAIAYHQGWLQLWHITLAAFFGGVGMAATLPAYQSMLPQLVAREHASNAIALHSIQFNVSRVIGPALGGIMLAWGATWSFGLNALSFLAVVAAMLFVRPLPSIHADLSIRQGLGDGISYLRSRTDLQVMCSLLFLNMFMASPALTMLPALTKDVLHADERTFSILVSCFGIGAVIAGLGMAFLSKHRPNPWRVFPFLMLTGACSVLLGVNHDPMRAKVLIIGAGIGVVTTNVSVLTAIISSTPEKIRGRISSFAALSLSCGYPVGSFIAGFLAKGLGVSWAFVIFGATSFFTAPLLWAHIRSRRIEYQHHAGQVAAKTTA